MLLRYLATFAVVALLEGCGGTLLAPTLVHPQSAAEMAASSASAAAGRNLYVNSAGSKLLVFAPGSSTPLRTIAAPVSAFAFYGGNVYVGSNTRKVTVYANGKLIRTITNGIIYVRGLAFDGAGKLYVANVAPTAAGTVTIYSKGGTKPVRTIAPGGGLSFEPTAVAVDGSGKIYVADLFREVNVYSSTGKLLRTLKGRPGNGIYRPMGLAFDRAGNLYVLSNDNVFIFAKSTLNLRRIISSGNPIRGRIDSATAMAIDSSDHLYVGYISVSGGKKDFVKEYDSHWRVVRNITDSISGPQGVAVDGSGTLYVSNAKTNSVTVYAPGSGTVERSISVRDPGKVGIGP